METTTLNTGKGETMTTKRRDRWNTYHETAYFGSFGGDERATGGVCRQEVRRVDGYWQRRDVNCNQGYRDPGPVEPIDDNAGEALFATAQQF